MSRAYRADTLETTPATAGGDARERDTGAGFSRTSAKRGRPGSSPHRRVRWQAFSLRPTHDAHCSTPRCLAGGLRAHFVCAAWVGFVSLPGDTMPAQRAYQRAQTDQGGRNGVIMRKIDWCTLVKYTCLKKCTLLKYTLSRQCQIKHPS